MKITTKTTREDLKHFLGANVNAVKKADKTLFDRLVYADKMLKKDDTKVSRKDLVDLAKDVMKVLGDKITVPALAQEPPVENSVKKLAKGVSKKQEIETPVEAESEKKTAKKSLGKKKKEEPKEGVTVLEENSDKTVQMAKMFPQTLEVGDTKYELADDIENMEDLYNALGDDQEIVFAYYWSKRHLKQFPYFNGLLGQPKVFDNDLDLATAIYVSDEKKVSYQVSMYTEAIYTIVPDDLKQEDGLRIAGGMEFQIYRAV